MVWTSYDESNETPWDTRRECSSCGLALEGGNSEVNTLDIVFNGYRKHILRLNIHSLILQDRHSNHYQQASCQLQGIEMLTEPEIGNDACGHEFKHADDTDAGSINTPYRAKDEGKGNGHANCTDEEDQQQKMRRPGTRRNRPGRLN